MSSDECTLGKHGGRAACSRKQSEVPCAAKSVEALSERLSPSQFQAMDLGAENPFPRQL